MIVGVSGPSASGKTTVARRLAAALVAYDPVTIASDGYYRDRSSLSEEEKAAIDYDAPDALDFDRLAADLKTLADGGAATPPQYDYVHHASIPGERTLGPSKLIIVEGILLFYPPPVAPLLDLRIFIEADREVRLARRIDRDGRERGRDRASVIRQFEATVEPGYEAYTLPTRSSADLIVDWNRYDDEAVADIVRLVTQRITG